MAGPLDIQGVLTRAAIPSDRTVGILRSVQEDPPEDSGAHHAGGPADDGSDDDGPMRGWVSPDDRLWLHPSERAQGGPSSRLAPVPDRLAGGRWVAGGMAACVFLTLVAVGMVMTTTDDTLHDSAPAVTWVSGVPTTELGLHRGTDLRQLSDLVRSAHDSTVALLVGRGSGRSVGTGVVAEAGGIIVTLQPVVAGADSITVVEPDGTRLAAVLVGTDTTTELTVLRITDELSAADFAEARPATGAMVGSVAMEPRPSAHLVPTARLYAGTVQYAATATGTWQGTGLCVTGVATPMRATDLGSPLIVSSGAIAGILYAIVGSGSQRTSVFLPAELVRDVVAQIVNHGSVIHGTLGLSAVDVPTAAGVGGGARIESVASDGAAAQAGLQSGDVVIGIDDQTVDTVAELSTRIYGESPETEVRFTVERGGITLHRVVILGQG